MAVTASRPITVKIGDFYGHKIVLPEEDESANQIDWTTATFSSQIRETASTTGSPLATFTIDTSHVEESPPYVLLTLAAVTTAALAAGTYVWDFQETRASKPRTPVGGLARVVQDVTR